VAALDQYFDRRRACFPHYGLRNIHWRLGGTLTNARWRVIGIVVGTLWALPGRRKHFSIFASAKEIEGITQTHIYKENL
jgi:hypothetical protein